MKNLILVLFLCISTITVAQRKKIEMAGDTVKVNNVPYALIQKPHAMSNDLTVKSLSGVELLYLQQANYTVDDRQKNYYKVLFLNDQRKCEMEFSLFRKELAKWIYFNDLIQDNAVNVKAEDRVVLLYGTTFSEKHQTTVIIKK